jgi:hypothetical protein
VTVYEVIDAIARYELAREQDERFLGLNLADIIQAQGSIGIQAQLQQYIAMKRERASEMLEMALDTMAKQKERKK